MNTLYKNFKIQSLQNDSTVAKNINQIKSSAAKMVLAVGKPKISDEPWRRTDIRKFNIEDFMPNNEGINFQVDLDESAIEILPLLDAIEKYPEKVAEIYGTVVSENEGYYAAFTTAITQNTLFIYIPEKKIVTTTPEIKISISDENTLATAHILVYADKRSSGQLFVTYSSENGKSMAFTGNTEVFLANDAKFTLIEHQNFGDECWNVVTEKAIVGQNANLTWIHGGFGSKLTKNFSTVEMNGKGSEAKMYGAVFVDGEQLLDHDSQQNHLAPHTFSDLDFKIAAKDKARSIWQGMIYVDPIAQQTDSYQNNQNLILSDDAHIDAIPGLEIQANDVSCSHGSSMLNLLEREIFYLLSRGIDRETAERTLIVGYFNAIIDHIKNDAIKQRFALSIQNKLQ